MSTADQGPDGHVVTNGDSKVSEVDPQPSRRQQGRVAKVDQTMTDDSSGGAQVRRSSGTSDSGWLTRRMFIFLLTFWPWYLYRLHYRLPTPVQPLDILDHPQPSEYSVLAHVAAMEDIGFRIVGLPQARQGEQYVIDQVNLLADRCRTDGILDCEVMIQEGSGFHEFNILDHDILKVYNGIRNVILRIRAKEPPSGRRVDKDAVLLASHIDSTLPSKGAADDAIGVGVMLDIARVVIDRKRPFDNSLLFMWNGGEETLQDGSHLYSTQHETAKDIRTVINLEAAGTTGGALVFQATSREMIDVFSHMPHRRGTVIAADIFASGIMMSDTDFGQFERYLNISGLDMAVVGHSYFYHTQKDLLQYIEKGTAQHFADNVQVAVDYLTSPASPILHSAEWSPPDMVYLSMYDRIFQSWSMAKALPVYIGFISSIATVLALSLIDFGQWATVLAVFLGTPMGLLSGLLASNLVAGVMSVMDHRLSWFKHEHICLFLYVPPAMLGYLGSQHILYRRLKLRTAAEAERLNYLSIMMFNTWGMLALQSLNIRSAYIFAVMSGIMILGQVTNTFVSSFKTYAGPSPANTSSQTLMGLGETYGPILFLCMAVGIEGFTTVLDTFVPLSGRTGKDAPSEYIIATLTPAISFIFFPIIPPLFHRLSRSWQVRTLRYLVAVTVMAILVFAGPWWKTYDDMHPKRTAVQYLYNHTNGEHTAHVGFMDLGPDMDFLSSLHERYGASGSSVKPTVVTKNDTDWDVLYPVSSFLQTYQFSLPAVGSPSEWPVPGVKAVEVGHKDGTRRLQVHFDFTGLVWPTVAFEADVIDWSYEFEPPKGLKRHHLKIATSVDTPILEMELAVKAEEGAKLKLEWSAIDLRQLVPQTAAAVGPDLPASRMLTDLDSWAKEKWRGAVDTLMFGTVTGVTEI